MRRNLELDEPARHEATFGPIQLKPALTQFKMAMKRAMNMEDGIQDFRPIKKHVQRLAHIDTLMQIISPPLFHLHKTSHGALDTMEKLIMNLSPDPFTGKPLPPGMLLAQLRIPDNLSYCPWDHLYECVKRNLDITDSACTSNHFPHSQCSPRRMPRAPSNPQGTQL